MFTQEVNVEAMYRATELMFGEQASMILAKLADVIDKAMADGYEQGLVDGLENAEVATSASFDNGFEAGQQNADTAEAYDDGYLAGVQDARANPALADETVQDIINVRAEDYYEALDNATFDDGGPYNESLVQDGGDATTINYRTYAG
jgi:flagellar biosynthesis/type III secretory pathway protein FliH